MKFFNPKEDILKFCFLFTGISICRFIIDKISEIKYFKTAE